MHFSTRIVTCTVIGFTIIALFCIITSTASHDPTSIFFHPERGYAPHYSTLRRLQAAIFFKDIDYAHPDGIIKADADPKKRKLCIGIPSVRRDPRDLPALVGSLLAGLSPTERQEIYLMVFTAHADPLPNPAWLPQLADEVLTYDFGPDRLQLIRNMEQSGSHFQEKRMLDYAYLLSKCADTYIPYVAIIEEDTLLADGWYARTMAALREAEEQVALHHLRTDFLYLRLFYTEEYLGWNAEYWPIYLRNSVYIASTCTILLLTFRLLAPRSKLSFRVFLLLYPLLALLILFFFALGRNTASPMRPGVHAMPAFGCCNQALVYPNHKIRELVVYLRDRKTGDLSNVLEDYTNENRDLSYVVSPSLVQHVGKGEGRIWSFGFERWSGKGVGKGREKGGE